MRTFTLLLCLFLMACQPEPSIRGREYTFTTDTGLTILLGFDAHTERYFGKAVNRYFGKYQVSRNKIMLTPPASTMKMGPEEYMADEEKYFEQLSLIRSYRVTDTDLTLNLADGSILHLTEQKNTPFKSGDNSK